MARAHAEKGQKALLEKIQKALVGLMGELAVATEDLARYEADGYARLKDEDLGLLDEEIVRLEKAAPQPTGWSTPGGNLAGAALDLARAVCRRAERGVWQLEKKEGNVRTIIPRYLNRLSDLLWLLEREISSWWKVFGLRPHWSFAKNFPGGVGAEVDHSRVDLDKIGSCEAAGLVVSRVHDAANSHKHLLWSEKRA